MSLIFLYSCATTKKVTHYKSWIVSSDQDEYIKKSLKLIQWFEKNGYKDFNQISEIDIAQGNCSLAQVACANPAYKKTIFLNYNFFQMSFLEQLGTIVHEAAHHRFGYQHIACTSKLIRNTDCDHDMYSAFGEEYKFYQSLKPEQNFSKNAVIRLLKNTRVRINTIQKND